jgi:ankyrin repeat protein
MYRNEYEKLHRAVREGNKKRVAKILATQEGKDALSLTNARGVSALEIAIKEKHNDIVNLLTNAGSVVNADIVMCAVESGCQNIMAMLLNHIPASDIGEICTIPLLESLRLNDTTMTVMLLDAGALIQPDFLNSAVYNNKIEVVRLLLERGTDPDLIFLESPLSLAVTSQHMEIIRLLLEHKADPNIENGRALFTAIRAERADIAKLLLENGAEPNITLKRYDAESALFLATQHSTAEMTKLLLDYQADPNFNNGEAFYYAAIKGKVEHFQLMLDAGGDERHLMPQIPDEIWALYSRRLLGAVAQSTITASARRRM